MLIHAQFDDEIDMKAAHVFPFIHNIINHNLF